MTFRRRKFRCRDKNRRTTFHREPAHASFNNIHIFNKSTPLFYIASHLFILLLDCDCHHHTRFELFYTRVIYMLLFDQKYYFSTFIQFQPSSDLLLFPSKYIMSMQEHWPMMLEQITLQRQSIGAFKRSWCHIQQYGNSWLPLKKFKKAMKSFSMKLLVGWNLQKMEEVCNSWSSNQKCDTKLFKRWYYFVLTIHSSKSSYTLFQCFNFVNKF